MFASLARSVIALTLGILFLLWMLIALAGETLSESAERRRMTTQYRRNRTHTAQSYRLTIEKVQS